MAISVRNVYIYYIYIYECMLITFFLKVTEVIILDSDLLLEITRITNSFYFGMNGFVLKISFTSNK